MKTCLVLRHVAFEDLGLLAEPLRRRGYGIRYVDAPVEALETGMAVAADLLIVLGGPVGAYEADRFPWLATEIGALEARLSAERATLGICLGAQLMAAALGSRVAPGPGVEIGWAPVTLSSAGKTSPLRVIEGLPVLHWHGDVLELPAGAVHLASTPLCQNQAFAIGHHALGLQFHVEVDPARFEHWLVANVRELKDAGISQNDLRGATRRHAAAMMAAAPRLLNAWLDGA